MDQIIEIKAQSKSAKLLLDLTAPCQKLIFDWCQHGMVYDPVVALALEQWLKPGDTFLDIGAHIGFFTVFAASIVGPEGRVISFEPNIRNFQFLQRNVQLNGFQNVSLLNAAVADQDGQVEFFENADHDGAHSLWPPGTHPLFTQSKAQQRSVTVQQVTIDRCTQELDLRNITAIKMDVEGAEYRVTQGAKRCLSNESVRLVICEHNRFGLQAMGANSSMLIQEFYSQGFRGFTSADGSSFNEIEQGQDFELTNEWLQKIATEKVDNILFIR